MTAISRVRGGRFLDCIDDCVNEDGGGGGSGGGGGGDDELVT